MTSGAPLEIVAGTRIGAFVLRRILGRGSMAHVWEAYHRPSETSVALKLLALEGAHDEVALVQDEARAVAGLDHPGVVRIHDVGTFVDGRRAPWLAMERCHGSLADRRGRGRPFVEVVATVRILLAALAHAHARGIVHRDVKPENVLFAPRGGVLAPVLSDFGIAHHLRSRRARDPDDGFAVGTPGYMAPEQWAGAAGQLGPWTDVYAVGCVAWELLAGRPPFEGPSITDVAEQQIRRGLPPLAPDVSAPRAFHRWLADVGAADPSRRTRSAAGAKAALDAIAPADPPDVWEPIDAEPAHDVYAGRSLGLYRMRRPRLVGREEQMTELRRRWRDFVRERRASAVVLRGAAGFGKTRLAEELAEGAEERGEACVLRVSHDAVGSAEDGLRGAVRRALCCENLGGAALAEQVATRGAILAPDATAADLAMVCEWLDQGVDRGLETIRFEALRRWLSRLALRSPVLLLLDDAHWGAQSIELVSHVLETMPRTAIFAVLTAQEEALADRPVERAHLESLLEHARAHMVRIGPLAPEATAALVGDLLHLEPSARSVVAERCSGNPLFAIELIGDWVDRRDLQPRGLAFELTPASHGELPISLAAAWEGRLRRALARVDEPEAIAVERAAFLGRQVAWSEWEAACAVDGCTPSASALDVLADAALLRRSERSFELVHGLAREGLVALAVREGRAELHHRAIADMLRAREAHPAVDERLGEHCLGAGLLEEALGSLRRAAEWRKDRGEYARAEALLWMYERALVRADVPEGETRWLEGWTLRSWLCRLSDRLDEAERWAARMEEHAERNDDALHRAHALLRRGEVLARRGDMRGAAPAYERAVEQLAAQGALIDALRARWGLGWARLMQGRLEEAADHFRWLAGVLEGRPTSEAHLAHIAWSLGHALLRSGDLAGAARAGTEARARADRGGIQLAAAHADNVLARIALLEGRANEAAEMAAGALSAFDALGSGERLFASLTLGEALDAAGRYAEAAVALDEGRARLERSGRHLSCWLFAARRLTSRIALGDLEGLLGDVGVIERDARRSGMSERESAVFVAAAARRARDAKLEAALVERLEGLERIVWRQDDHPESSHSD